MSGIPKVNPEELRNPRDRSSFCHGVSNAVFKTRSVNGVGSPCPVVLRYGTTGDTT